MSTLSNSPSAAAIDDACPDLWTEINEKQQLRLQQYCNESLDLPDPLESALHCNIAYNLALAQMISREILEAAVDAGGLIEVLDAWGFAVNAKHQMERQAERCVRVIGELRQRVNGPAKTAGARLAVSPASEEDAT